MRVTGHDDLEQRVSAKMTVVLHSSLSSLADEEGMRTFFQRVALEQELRRVQGKRVWHFGLCRFLDDYAPLQRVFDSNLPVLLQHPPALLLLRQICFVWMYASAPVYLPIVAKVLHMTRASSRCDWDEHIRRELSLPVFEALNDFVVCQSRSLSVGDAHSYQRHRPEKLMGLKPAVDVLCIKLWERTELFQHLDAGELLRETNAPAAIALASPASKSVQLWLCAAECCRQLLAINSPAARELVHHLWIHREEIRSGRGDARTRFSRLVTELQRQCGDEQTATLMAFAATKTADPHVYGHLARFLAIVLKRYDDALDSIRTALASCHQDDSRSLHTIKGDIHRLSISDRCSSDKPPPLADVLSAVTNAIASYHEGGGASQVYSLLGEIKVRVLLLTQVCNEWTNRDRKRLQANTFSSYVAAHSEQLVRESEREIDRLGSLLISWSATGDESELAVYNAQREFITERFRLVELEVSGGEHTLWQRFQENPRLGLLAGVLAERFNKDYAQMERITLRRVLSTLERAIQNAAEHARPIPSYSFHHYFEAAFEYARYPDEPGKPALTLERMRTILQDWRSRYPNDLRAKSYEATIEFLHGLFARSADEARRAWRRCEQLVGRDGELMGIYNAGRYYGFIRIRFRVVDRRGAHALCLQVPASMTAEHTYDDYDALPAAADVGDGTGVVVHIADHVHTYPFLFLVGRTTRDGKSVYLLHPQHQDVELCVRLRVRFGDRPLSLQRVRVHVGFSLAELVAFDPQIIVGDTTAAVSKE
jgi:hypothetical protein